MKNWYNYVKMMLTTEPATRDDDMLLYAKICYRSALVGSDTKFMQVMCNSAEWGLPSYESISRARRKVQEDMPELRGTKRNIRKVEEQVYREHYSKN